MTTLTQKSQVTIPKAFRAVFGLRPGDQVDFAVEENKLVLRKKPREFPFEKWKGYLGKFKTDELMKELR